MRSQDPAFHAQKSKLVLIYRSLFYPGRERRGFPSFMIQEMDGAYFALWLDAGTSDLSPSLTVQTQERDTQSWAFMSRRWRHMKKLKVASEYFHQQQIAWMQFCRLQVSHFVDGADWLDSVEMRAS